jgi:hypothetical protein
VGHGHVHVPHELSERGEERADSRPPRGELRLDWRPLRIAVIAFAGAMLAGGLVFVLTLPAA